MIDIMRTILAATDEYEMRYGKHPMLFINRSLHKAIIADIELRRDCSYMGLDNMLIYGYPTKLVLDDSDEMHFWIGDQKPIYGKEN